MSNVVINGSGMSNQLQQLLMTDDIIPGSSPSYEVCKLVYEYHPLGQKMAEAPLTMAQSQEREITIPGAPEERVKAAFIAEWRKLNADENIKNVMKLSRIYGIASIAMLEEDGATDEPVDFAKLYNSGIAFNAFDPLNTAGSLVLNQNPNDMDFQKHSDIRVGSKTYHRSRTVVILNEQPIYIGYTVSAFGYVGRSVYQRALFPLKSFIQTLVTDDLITRKSGVFIAKMKQPGNFVDNVMSKAFAVKRALLKEAETGNVMSIALDEEIQSLDLHNLDGAYSLARTNILKNIATAADMPAQLLENETMVSGFGEGTEDAKNIARYVDGVRTKMGPLYTWFDRITMHRAWNPDFYKTIQRDYPEYADVSYEDAFYQWSNAFTAEWPNLLVEPDSEKSKVEEIKMKAAISAVEVLLPVMDTENKAIIVEWLAENFNGLKLLFPNPLLLDPDTLREGLEHHQGEEDEMHQPRIMD